MVQGYNAAHEVRLYNLVAPIDVKHARKIWKWKMN